MKASILLTAAVAVMPLAPTAHTQSLAEPRGATAIHAAISDNVRVAALVPADLTPEDACRGLKDLGQCSAALHASQNLNIPFAALKGRLTAGQSLAAAIHAVKPSTDARREAQRAEKQARDDLAAQG